MLLMQGLFQYVLASVQKQNDYALNKYLGNLLLSY